MSKVDWDLVLDGSIYELSAPAYGTTVSSLRAQAHYHAEKRGKVATTVRVQGHNILRVQAHEPGPARTMEVPALVRVELTTPGPVPVVQRPDPTPAPVAYDDPDDYSGTCTCGSYPKCTHLCFNFTGEAPAPAPLDPGSNGHKPVPSSLTAPAGDSPDPDPGT